MHANRNTGQNLKRSLKLVKILTLAWRHYEQAQKFLCVTTTLDLIFCQNIVKHLLWKCHIPLN